MKKSERKKHLDQDIGKVMGKWKRKEKQPFGLGSCKKKKERTLEKGGEKDGGTFPQ